MHMGNIAVLAFAELVARQCPYQFVNHIVNIHKVQHHIRIIHLDCKIVCNIVAEGSHNAIVVGAAPLTKEIREAVHQHLGTGIFRILEHQFLSGLLGLPVGVVKSGLTGRTNHHGTSVLILLEGVQQCGGESKVPFHKLLRVFWAVHACEIEDEVGLFAILLQLFRFGINIVLKHLQALCRYFVPASLACGNIVQLSTKVLSHKTFGSCY